MVDRHGEIVPLVQSNILPSDYTELTAQPAYLAGATLCVLFGFVLVLLLERIGNLSK